MWTLQLIGWAAVLLLPMLGLVIYHAKTRNIACGKVLGTVLGVTCGGAYGDYLNQPHLLMSRGPWVMLASMVVGAVVGLAAAILTQHWWDEPLRRALDWLAARAPRRISLRSLLIATAICAIACGFYAHRVRLRRPVQDLMDRNMTVYFDYQRLSPGEYSSAVEPPTPRWLRFLLGDDQFRTVAGVLHHSGRNVQDEDMKAFASYPKMEVLVLENSDISDTGIRHIAGLRELRKLDLHDNQVRNAGLAELRGMSALKHLGLSENGIDDDGLAYLSKMHGLLQLDLSDNALTDDGLVHLAALTNLESLDLSENSLTGDDLIPLAAMNKLKSLSLRVNSLNRLDLAPLGALTNLQTLELAGTQINDDHLATIGQFPKLQYLELTGTAITDEAITYLEKAAALRRLVLFGTNITDTGAARLQKALPACQIIR